jgi:membrane-associated protease RseP (regulator of RpoE activity)
MALATAIALALAGFTATTQAQQQQQQRLEDRKEQQREEHVRSVNEQQRRLSDNRRMQAMNDRAKWLEQRKRKPVLGVLLAPDAQAGVRIAGVTPNSAAAEAGLKSGDRVISIDGRQVLGSSGELRVENARKLLAKLDSKTPVRLVYVREGREGVAVVTPRIDQQVFLLRSGDAAPMAFGHDGMLPPGVAPKIRRELIRIGPGGECKGKDCKLPMLAQAFRWNGLNLASVDAQLGRYFGTDRGVLVLSTGPELAGLQAGDVIRKVDGKTVDTPREAMEALQSKPDDSVVAIEYLRDRKAGVARMKVPKALPLRVPLPPPPPPAPPMPPVPPPPPPPGTAFEFEIETHGDVAALAFLPMPPAAPDAPLPPLPPEIVEGIEVEAR